MTGAPEAGRFRKRKPKRMSINNNNKKHNSKFVKFSGWVKINQMQLKTESVKWKTSLEALNKRSTNRKCEREVKSVEMSVQVCDMHLLTVLAQKKTDNGGGRSSTGTP